MSEVSIIVPIYKVEKVLHYCVDSILNQSFSDFELILVDDGSPDNSGAICDEYAKKDSRITVVHKANGGVSSARNIGIERAAGKYICFIDSDDYIDNNYLECLIETKNKYPVIDNIWCGFKTVNSYNRDCGFIQNIVYDEIDDISTSDLKDIMTLHEKWLDAGPCCKLYKSSIIKNNNLQFDNNLSLGEDLTFNFQYLDCTNGRILVINKSLYNYFISSNNSLGSKYYSNLLEIYQNLNIMMNHYINKWNCDDVQIGKYYSACFYKYEVILKNTFHKECVLSQKDKYKFNNSILRSDDFKKSIKCANCNIHPIIKISYKSGNYRLITFTEKVIELLKGKK